MAALFVLTVVVAADPHTAIWDVLDGATSEEHGSGAFDKAYGGFMDKESLQRWLASYRMPANGADLSRTYAQMDTDFDGSVSFAELIAEMREREGADVTQPGDGNTETAQTAQTAEASCLNEMDTAKQVNHKSKQEILGATDANAKTQLFGEQWYGKTGELYSARPWKTGDKNDKGDAEFGYVKARNKDSSIDAFFTDGTPTHRTWVVVKPPKPSSQKPAKMLSFYAKDANGEEAGEVVELYDPTRKGTYSLHLAATTKLHQVALSEGGAAKTGSLGTAVAGTDQVEAADHTWKVFYKKGKYHVIKYCGNEEIAAEILGLNEPLKKNEYLLLNENMDKFSRMDGESFAQYKPV